MGQRWSHPAGNSSEIGDLAVWLQEQVLIGHQQVESLTSEIDELERQIQDVRQAGGSFPEHLVDVSSKLDGRLLAERFESVPYDRAAEVEARLGPLVQAIVVESPREAVRALADIDRRPETLWILDGPRTALDLEHLPEGQEHTGVVTAPVPGGIRSTRLPKAPMIGRQAREKLLDRLQEELETAEGRLAEARERVRALEHDIALLKPHLSTTDLLDRGDPAADLAAARERLTNRREALQRAAEIERDHEKDAQRLKARLAALEELWSDSSFLDPPDYASEAKSLALRISEAIEAERRLEQVATEREAVEKELDLLRSPPPDEAARAELEKVATTARERRRFWLTPVEDLETVAQDLEALGFGNAEERIRKDETLLAALNEEVEAAERRLEQARSEREVVKGEENRAEAALREAKTTRDVCDQRIADLQADLDDTGVADPSDAARAAAEEAVARAESAQRAATAALREAVQRTARLEPQVEAARGQLQSAEADLKDKAAQAGPAVDRWGRLRKRCEDLGLLDAALGEPSLASVSGKASIEVFQLRRDAWVAMLERLDQAEESGELAETLRLLDNSTETGSEQFLEAWLETRRWLALRVPKHVSEVDDPVDALRRLRQYLVGLVDRLERYEDRLKGDSRDIARSIESRLRKVNNLLNKLNRELHGVGFGSIEAIRLKSERDSRMSEILTALSSPESRQALFGADRTIEVALDEIFLRHGGRRHGGRQVLDYRQYLRLRVEIRRRGSESWEEARANQMSTGEAIGVGAAIMMVVLTAWEREAGLMRPRQQTGSLRFLFLDEATRLSLDNLEVLFDLCETLELQLLIAAPEVATSKGNTTYLLQRGTDTHGREVVHVSGRRAIRKDE